MEVVISRASNGAIIKLKDEESNNSAVYVYDEDNLEGLRDLLYDLCETMGPINGRHSKERIQVKIVHGDKYDCKDEKCKICKEEE